MATLERPDYLGSVQTADHPSGYSKVWFSRDGKCSHAVVVRAVPSGFILCLPPGAINEEELDQATADGYVGELGPWTVSNVTATSVHGRELKKVLPCLLIDFAASAFSYLSMNAPSAGSSGDILTFGVVRLQSVWPSRLNLLVALEAFLNCDELDERLDAYFTGEENLDPPLPLPATFDIGSTGVGEAEVGTDGAEQGRATQDLLHQLLMQSTSQAGLLEKMQEKLVKVDSLESRIAQLEVPEASASTPARMFSTAVKGAPAWAPQLFGEGAQAKLDPEQVKQLLVLAGRGPKNLGDVGSASSAIQPKTNASILGASAKARPAPMTLLGAAPEGGEEDEDVPGAGADDGEASALARILVQQTQILNQLASSSKKSSDPLQSLLGGGGGGDDEAKIPGVRGMAARQLLREQFAAHPERVVAKVRERLALARRKGSVAELEPRDMYLHFQETVPLGTFKTLTYFSFLMAEMWEAAERNQGAELMSLLALGLVFAEQVANEQGHTRLGWLLTGRPDPPFSIVEQRRAPRPELPHGMLADPRWVTAQLAYLRDADLISERTTKVHLNLTPQGGQQGQDDGTKGPGRGRGRKGKRTDQTGETTA